MTPGGNGHNSLLVFTKPLTRVVCLVPSSTKSIIDLNCGHTLVGVTEYCPRPEGDWFAETVGGTRGVDVDKITALKPELIIANQEENERGDIEALEAAGLKVWVSFPKTIPDAIQILWVMARLFGITKEATPKILLIERSLDWVQRGENKPEPTSVFVPIWQDEDHNEGTYWMTFNKHTYCDSVLRTCGASNVFRSRQRRYPLEAEFEQPLAEDPGKRDTRYPRVGAEEVLQASPDMILLPSEPFGFTSEDQAQIEELLSDTPAVQKGSVFCVDGRWLSWHGTMLAHALVELPALLDLAGINN